MDNSNNENKYLKARERVEQLRRFYGNLSSYVIFCILLAIINYWTNEWRYMWFLWAVFGWGIGIIFHAISTFRLNPFFNKDWEERKIREFMKEEEHTTKWE